MENKGSRKIREGVVVSNKMDKTVVIRVENTVRHPQFGKVTKRAKKYYAHVETPVEIGQKVTIEETRPLSKLKRWRVVGAKA